MQRLIGGKSLVRYFAVPVLMAAGAGGCYYAGLETIAAGLAIASGSLFMFKGVNLGSKLIVRHYKHTMEKECKRSSEILENLSDEDVINFYLRDDAPKRKKVECKVIEPKALPPKQ